MKHPPRQMRDDDARVALEAFLAEAGSDDVVVPAEGRQLAAARKASATAKPAR